MIQLLVLFLLDNTKPSVLRSKKKNFSLVTMLGFLLQNIILPVSNIVIEFFQTAAEM